jgi:hypothetical protein
VRKLKDLAQDMGNELERQNQALEEVDNKVEGALEHMDNVNVKLKKTVDKVCIMKSLENYQQNNQLDTCTSYR